MGNERIKRGDLFLLPPRPNLCQECAVSHLPEHPHNQQSLYYQTFFYMKHGRYPTWHDAMEHCSEEMKTLWLKHLRQMGVNI
jgi:hypothetical protein